MSDLSVTNTNNIIELQRKFAELQYKLLNLEKDHDELLDKYLGKDKESEGLLMTIEALTKKSALMDEITRNNEALQLQILKFKKLEQDYEMQNKKKEILENNNAQLKKNIDFVTQQVEYLQQERNLFQEANEELAKRYEKISKKITNLEKEKKKLLYQLGGSQIEKQNMLNLQKELQELRNDKNRIVMENDQLNTRVALLDKKVAEKNSLLNQNANQLSALETVLQEIKTQNLSLQKSKEKEIAYRANNLQLQNKVSDLEREKSILEKHTQELLQTGGVLESENARLINQISELQNIIQKLDK